MLPKQLQPLGGVTSVLFGTNLLALDSSSPVGWKTSGNLWMSNLTLSRDFLFFFQVSLMPDLIVIFSTNFEVAAYITLLGRGHSHSWGTISSNTKTQGLQAEKLFWSISISANIFMHSWKITSLSAYKSCTLYYETLCKKDGILRSSWNLANKIWNYLIDLIDRAESSSLG